MRHCDCGIELRRGFIRMYLHGALCHHLSRGSSVGVILDSQNEAGRCLGGVRPDEARMEAGGEGGRDSRSSRLDGGMLSIAQLLFVQLLR